MSLVRQLAKANAREAERRRVEEEQANRNISIEAIPNTVPAPDVNSDSFHNMTYTETYLGAIDFQRVQDSVAVVIPKKRGKYEKYTDKERYDIGKYGSEYGATAAVRKFKKDYPSLNGSTVRCMKKKYEDLLKYNRSGITEKVIKNRSKGRPFMLGPIDEMVQSYIKEIRERGGMSPGY